MDNLLPQLLDSTLSLAHSVAVIQSAVKSNDPFVTSAAIYTGLRRGRTASDRDILDLTLQTPADDLALLIVQLGSWFLRAPHDPTIQAKRQHAIFRLIDIYPYSEIHEYPDCWLYASFDRRAYTVAKKKWLHTIAGHPNNVRILSNAAHHFALHDYDLASSLLERAIIIEPNEPKSEAQLVRLRQLHSNQ